MKADYILVPTPTDSEHRCDGCLFQAAGRAAHSSPGSEDCRTTRCAPSENGDVQMIAVAAPIPARANDPHTRKTAATKVKRASIKHHIMLTLAIENPTDGGGYAWTGTEIAAKNQGLRLNSITPRFAELRREGKIKATTTVRNGELAWVLV